MKNHKLSTVAFVVCSTLFGSFVGADDAIKIAEIKHDGPVDFEKEILPVLRRKCLACHNATDAESDLVLETPDLIRKGGSEGPSVVPGKGAESLLVMLGAKQKESYMPPEDNDVGAKPLTPEELGLLKLWIDQGAEGTVSAAGSITWQPLPIGVNPIYSVAVTEDGQYAAAGRANQIFIYHLPSKREIGRLTDPELLKSETYDQPGVAHFDLVQSLAFNPAGDVLASGGFRTVKLWRRIANKNLGKWNLPNKATALTPSADGATLAVGGEDGSIKIVNLADGKVTKTMTGHGGPVTGIAFAAGDKLVSGSADKTVRVWNLADGKEVASLETPTPVTAVAVAGDGKLVVSAGDDNKIRSWTFPGTEEKPAAAAAGEEPAGPTPVKEFAGHSGRINLMSLANSDPNHFVSASEDGTIRIWDVNGGNMIRQIAAGGPVKGMAVNHNGTAIASVTGNNTAKLWNATNSQLIKDLKGDYRKQLEVTRSTRQVNVAKRNLAQAKKDLDEANKRKKSEEDNAKKAEETAKKAAEEFKAKTEAAKKPVADKEAADKVLEASTAERTKAEEAKNKAEEAFKAADEALKKANEDLAKADDAGKEAAQKGVDEATKKRADAEKARNDSNKVFADADKKFKADEANVKKLAAPAQKATDELNAADRANKAAIRSVQRSMESVKKSAEAVPVVEKVVADEEAVQKQKEEVQKAATEAVPAAEKNFAGVAFSADGSTLVTVGDGQVVYTWDAVTGAAMDSIEGHAANLTHVGFHNGSIYSIADDNSVNLWDASMEWTLERVIGSIEDKMQLVDRVTALDFSSDGKMLATGSGEPSRSGEIKIWNAADGKLVRALDEPHSDTVFSLEFSPDDTLLASSAADRFMKVFQVGDGKFVRSFEGHTHHVLGVSWSGDGRTLASSGADKVIKVWDARTGDQKKTITGFNKEVTSVRFLIEKDEMVASCGDKNVHMKRADGGNIRTLAGGQDFMYSVGVSGDGNMIVGGGEDSVMRVWSNNGQSFVNFEAPKPPAEEEAAK